MSTWSIFKVEVSRVSDHVIRKYFVFPCFPCPRFRSARTGNQTPLFLPRVCSSKTNNTLILSRHNSALKMEATCTSETSAKLSKFTRYKDSREEQISATNHSEKPKIYSTTPCLLPWLWRVLPPGIYHRVVRRKSTDVSEEHVNSSVEE
jgi:hypothetical protein